MLKTLLFLAFTIFSSSVITGAQAHDNIVSLEENVSTRPLDAGDEKSYVADYVKSFMAVFKKITYIITLNDQSKMVGPKDTKDKERRLKQTAEEEFVNYVLKPKEDGYKGIAVLYKGKVVGGLLYRLMEDGNTIYLSHYHILPKFQKKGIGAYVIENILPTLHPQYKRYEVLTRHQDDAAFLLYRKLGFSWGDIDLVKKYDYDPLRYMGFYKDLA